VLIGFVFAGELWQVVALFAAYGIFVAVDESVNKAYVSDISDEKTRAMALGAYSSACGAVYLPANIIFGVVWASFGAAPAFGAAAAIAILAGIIMLAKG